MYTRNRQHGERSAAATRRRGQSAILNKAQFENNSAFPGRSGEPAASKMLSGAGAGLGLALCRHRLLAERAARRRKAPPPAASSRRRNAFITCQNWLSRLIGCVLAASWRQAAECGCQKTLAAGHACMSAQCRTDRKVIDSFSACTSSDTADIAPDSYSARSLASLTSCPSFQQSPNRSSLNRPAASGPPSSCQT